MLVILLAHEMGHYIACRYHRLDATLPFFLPVPFGIGTLGAFIRIRTPLLNKRELFDVGASGPLAGFVVALPVLFAGIALSTPVAELPKGGVMIFGEPLAFKAIAWLVHPDVPPGGDLLLHPLGFAAWFGLLVTALNLLPFGQLDGGHITYALFGAWQRRIAWPLLAVLVVLGFWWSGWWIWAVIALVMRVRHPWIPDEAATLDPRRRLLGFLCIASSCCASRRSRSSSSPERCSQPTADSEEQSVCGCELSTVSCRSGRPSALSRADHPR